MDTNKWKTVSGMIREFPNGSLITRRRGNGEYYYYTHRDNGKVVSTYLGTSESVDKDAVLAEMEQQKRMLAYEKGIEEFRTKRSPEARRINADYLHRVYERTKTLEFYDIPDLMDMAQTPEEAEFFRMIAEYVLRQKQNLAVCECRF